MAPGLSGSWPQWLLASVAPGLKGSPGYSPTEKSFRLTGKQLANLNIKSLDF